MKLQVFVSIWSLSKWYLYYINYVDPAHQIVWLYSMTMSSLVLEDYKLQPQQNPPVFRPSSPSACGCDHIQNLGKRSFVGHIPIHAKLTTGRVWWPKITIALRQWIIKGSKLGFPSQKNEQLNHLIPHGEGRVLATQEQYVAPTSVEHQSQCPPAEHQSFLNGLGKLFPVPCVRDRGQSTNQLCQFKCLSTQQSWWLRH